MSGHGGNAHEYRLTDPATGQSTASMASLTTGQYQQYAPPQSSQLAQATTQPAPVPPLAQSQTPSSLRTGPLPLDLGFIPAASSSQTSLLEAVVGPTARNAPAPTPSSYPVASTQPIPARAPSAYTYNQPTSRPRAGGGPGSGSGAGSTGSSQPGSRDHSGSEGSRSFGTSTEREWDVLSDKSLKMNEGDDPEAVEELQKKVNKRRSNLPHLENELAALEAQIKAAEERIAKAQSGGQRV